VRKAEPGGARVVQINLESGISGLPWTKLATCPEKRTRMVYAQGDGLSQDFWLLSPRMWKNGPLTRLAKNSTMRAFDVTR
jgi:hypothetical protein